MEVLGKAQVDMREAPDPRVHLEVVLIRLTHPEADDSPAALLERIERLEQGRRRRSGTVASIPAPDPAPVRRAAPAPAPPAAAPGTATGSPGRDAARRRRGRRPPSDGAPALAARGSPRCTGPDRPAGPRAADVGTRADGAGGPGRRPPPEPAPARRVGRPLRAGPGRRRHAVGTTEVTRDELVQLWGDSLLASLPGRARARFRVGRFVAVEGGTAVFALPNETHRSYCEEVRTEVETALGRHFGVARPAAAGGRRRGRAIRRPAPVPGDRRAPTAGRAALRIRRPRGRRSRDLLDPVVLAAETELAGAGLSPEERLKQAFPGAEEV